MLLVAAAAAAAAAAVVASAAAGGPADWPAIANKSCHAEGAHGRWHIQGSLSHAQCAAACAAKGCGCFDLTAQGNCEVIARFWGLRANLDRTAYSNSTVPVGPPSPAPPAPPAPPPPQPPLNPAAAKLALKYGQLRNETCAKAVAREPVLPSAASAAFMAAYRAFNGSNDETPVLRSAASLLALPDVQAFFALPDSFSATDGLDFALVQCAAISAASALGLAEFAANGTAEETLVDNLLSDSNMLRDMLVAGGPREGKYGKAMQIYLKITEASDSLPLIPAPPSTPDGMWDDRSPATMLRRLALGTALGHAVPVQKSFSLPNDTNAFVDPVARYLHYERAYRAGELDPAIEVLTTFECRHTTDSDAKEDDLAWFRDTAAIYRPDVIAMPYHTRYAEAVHTDVAYGHPGCDLFKPGACNGHEAQIPAGGGECGPRAFFGRFSRKAFGLPTWGVTEPGHAAMSTWSPDTSGWYVLLGAGWQHAWWGRDGYNQGGSDFFLDTQCRENRTEYRKVLRASWLATARGDAPINHGWTPTTGRSHNPSGYGEGGLWSALALYMKKIAVNGTDPKLYNRTVPPPSSSSVKTKVQAMIDQWAGPPPPPPHIVTGADGSIIIPAAAVNTTLNTTLNGTHEYNGRLTVMRSACTSAVDCDTGEQLLTGVHTGMDKTCTVDPSACSFAYDFTAATGGTFYLTANFSTWQMNQDLSLSVNGNPSQPVPVFYTVGWWNETQPLEVTLVKGHNNLNFKRSTERTVTFKSFVLHSKKPDVPAPFPPYTPSPTPPPSAYHQVPPTTTCEKQGITAVPVSECPRACTALGLNYGGAKAVETDMPGCMAIVTGHYKGSCMYNTNTSTQCEDPPCYNRQAGCVTPTTPNGCEVAEVCLTK
jgi:hypothetical protein